MPRVAGVVLSLVLLGSAAAQTAADAAAVPAAPLGPIAPRLLVTTVVGESVPGEKCWAMPDSLEGDIDYVSAGGRFTVAAGASITPSLTDPRWVDGAERVFVPGVTVDPLALPKSADISQLWFDWRAPTLVRLVKGRGLVLVAGRTNLVMREVDDVSLGRDLKLAECAKAASSEDPLVREGAAWMLGWIPVTEAELDEAERALGTLAADPVDDVALTAIESLGRVGRAGQAALLEASAATAPAARAAFMKQVAGFLRQATIALDEKSGPDARIGAIRAMGGTGLQQLFLKRFRDVARTKDVYVAAVAVASSPNQRAPGPLAKSFFLKSGIVADFRATHPKAELAGVTVPASFANDPAVQKWVALLYTGQPADLYQKALPLKL
jgi:hypothetical protein